MSMLLDPDSGESAKGRLGNLLRESSSPVKTANSLAESVFNELLEEVTLGIAFEVHRSVKTGQFHVTSDPENPLYSSSSTTAPPTGLDVFGSVITTAVGVPALKKQPECVCPNCQRNMAATRFAPHLEKCMGMGRNSSRLASRRLATSSKDNYRDSGGGGNDDEDDAEDEDWIEPGKVAGGGGGGSHKSSKSRRTDRNSPRRGKAGGRMGAPSDGSITPPSSYDSLTIEERSSYLSTVCGVISNTSRKICTRSIRCPVHTDAQRREIRIKWLSQHPEEETHVDIDSFTEGDTVALRETLSQLSGASSPAESTISTSSHTSIGNSTRSSRRGEKRGRGKKRQPGSKAGSRGSTPPLLME